MQAVQAPGSGHPPVDITQTATLPIGALCTRLILQSAVVCFDANARVNTEGRKPLHYGGSRSHRCYIHRYNLQGTRHCGLPPMHHHNTSLYTAVAAKWSANRITYLNTYRRPCSLDRWY